MQYLAVIILVCFLVKSVSFSIFELKNNNNKLGGSFCLVVSILSFIFAIVALVISYGQAFV